MGILKCSATEVGKLPVIYLKEWKGKALMDTGSNATFMSEKFYNNVSKKELNFQLKECNCQVKTVNGVSRVVGYVDINCKQKLKGKPPIRVHVIKEMGKGYDIIIGTDVMERWRCFPQLHKKEWFCRLGNEVYKGVENRVRNKIITSLEVENKERSRRLNKEDPKKRRSTSETNEERMIILKEMKDVFFKEGDKLSATGRVSHEIDLITDRPVYIKPRRYPYAMREIIKTHIKEMMDQKIIRKSKSPYCSPLWVVPKRTEPGHEQKYRVVVDYRELNKKTKCVRYPLPRIEDMIDRMATASYFSTLDLKNGYHQIKMNLADVEKTAFSFERGHYEFLRMPFGLKNAPATFQKLMDEFLEGLDSQNIQIYMDDIVVFTQDKATHMDLLRNLIKRLKHYNLKVSKEKTHLFKRKVKFMGYIISENGVQPDPDKVETIWNIPTPKNVKEVRRILGMFGYYRKFIKNFAFITEPLTKLLKKGKIFKIDQEVQRSIENCKEILSRLPNLKFPNLENQFILTTDASQVAIGAVLSQKDNGVENPVAFASKKLTPAETRYSTIEREMLGIVWAIEKFRTYLYGRTFEVRTDHKPLVWIQGLKETSARVTRWKERLAAYEFFVKHVKGSDNVVADCLSRNVNTLELEDETSLEEQLEVIGDVEPGLAVMKGHEPETEHQIEVTQDIINNKRNQLIFTTKPGDVITSYIHNYGHLKIWTIDIGSEVTSDKILKLLNSILIRGKVYHMYFLSDTVKEKVIDLYRKQEIIKGIHLIICTKQVQTIENANEQRRIIEDYHNSKTNHRGETETLKKLQRQYYWIKQIETIREIIKRCEVCNRVKYDREPYVTPQMITPTPEEPFQIIQIDLFYFENFKFLTTIDLFSKLATAWSIQSKSAKIIMETLLSNLSLFKLPELIIADKGREFDNKSMRNLMAELGIKLHFTTTGHSKSHGSIERLHNTLIEHLSIIKESRNIIGKEAMARAILAYNNSIHSSTDRTPLEIASNSNLRTEIIKKITNEKLTRTGKYNEQKSEDIEGKLLVGDEVYVKNHYRRTKSDKRYIGPYEVVEMLSRFKVKVKPLRATSGNVKIVHIEEIKRKPKNCSLKTNTLI